MPCFSGREPPSLLLLRGELTSKIQVSRVATMVDRTVVYERRAGGNRTVSDAPRDVVGVKPTAVHVQHPVAVSIEFAQPRPTRWTSARPIDVLLKCS
jgi:hypothetical protein